MADAKNGPSNTAASVIVSPDGTTALDSGGCVYPPEPLNLGDEKPGGEYEIEDDAFAPRRWVKTQHGWSKECQACGSTNFTRPCRETEDGFHV